MYWPNEPAHLHPGGKQVGGREAFSAMLADGTIGALEIFSYRVIRAQHSGFESFEQSALQAIAGFRPDILFVQHVAGTDLTSGFWRQVRHASPQLTIAYHEGDPFDPWFKRIDRATAAALAKADLIFSCGLGSLAKLLARHSSAPILHLPHCVDRVRFGRIAPEATKKTHALTMIGNCGKLRKMPLLYLPGGERRRELAMNLTDIWGERFALYGSGWGPLASARGSLPFDKQEAAIQRGRISVNWDHFDRIESYFSDRLPISLAAGVPHVSTWHPGLDRILAGCPGLYLCESVQEAIHTCRALLDRSDESLLQEGAEARRWVLQHLEAEVVFRRAIAQTLAYHRERLAS